MMEGVLPAMIMTILKSKIEKEYEASLNAPPPAPEAPPPPQEGAAPAHWEDMAQNEVRENLTIRLWKVHRNSFTIL